MKYDNTTHTLHGKLRLCLAAFALLAGLVASADTTYIWTGAANDGGLWTTPRNWDRNDGYPNGAGNIVQFDGDATVTLDTGTATPIKLMKVNSGVVTINGTAGSYLKATFATAGFDELFNVGNKNTMDPAVRLILNVPVDAGGLRCDKWYGGVIVFRSAFTNTMNNAGNYGFLFGSGSNALENACSFYQPNCLLGLGNGGPITGTQVLSIADGVQLAAYSIRYPLRAENTQEVVILQDGDDTAVTLGHDIEIGAATVKSSYTSTLRPSYQLRGGRLAVGGNIYCGLSGKGIGRFEMSGGTLELGGTVQRVAGGRFVYSGGTILTSTDRTGLPIPDWAEVEAAPVFGATAGKTLALNSWNLPYPIRKVGAGTVLIADNTTMTITNDVFVEEGTFKLGSHIRLDAPSGDYTPWKIKIASGATLRFTDLTSRLSRPLDLEIEEGGKVHFPQAGEGDGGLYMRSMIIAHRLTQGGVRMGRGRYEANSYFSAYQGAASIVVPYVWTGAAGDGIWETPGNWEDGAVPVGGSTDSIADLSRADGQTITITKAAGYCLGGIIANPNGRTRKVTLKGSTLMLQNKAQFNCVLYVGEGCELVMDIDYEQSSGGYYWAGTALGGGKITFLKRYPDVVGASGGYAPINADATLVFAGTNMTCMGGTGIEEFVLGGSLDLAGRGQAILEDGAKITARRFRCGVFIMAEILQRGATVDVDEFALTRMSGSYPVHWQPFLYRFEKGAITCSTGFYQGTFLSTSESARRYSGGEFQMTGGTLTTPLIQTWAYTQYLNFYGGTINLGGGGMTLDTTRTYNGGGGDFISDPVRLGGVRLHATADSSSDVPLTLDGVNGDPEIDTDGHDMTFTGAVSGAGGFVKSGTGAAIFTGTCSFGGTARVQGGSVVFGETSSLGACRIVVADGSLSLLGAVDPGLSLDISSTAALTLPASETITVKQLTIGGVRQTAGSYSIGGGTVTVATVGAEDAVWIGASGGNWNVGANWQDNNIPNGATAAVDFGLSALESNATIRLDGNVTLKELSFSHPDEGAKLTIGAGGGTLTISSGATITVERGRTLEIAADVVMGPRSDGSITVAGGGTLRFTGKVRPVAAVASLTSQQSAWMIMEDGVLDFAGEVEGVRPMIYSTANIPRIVFSGNLVATNKFAPNIAWKGGGSHMTGEIVQDGGTFGLDVLHPDFASTGFYLGNPGYGEIAYTLNNGVFRMNRTYPTCFNYNTGAWGHFTFTVNGGEVDFSNYVWGGRTGGDYEKLTLNPGGTLRFRSGFGIPVGRGDIVLNGGRIESTFSGTLIASSRRTVLTLGGTVVFAQSAAADVVTIENALGGTGVIEQQGPGTLVLGRCSPGIAAAVVSGGTLTFADEMPCETCAISGGGTLNLDFDGTLELEGMTVNGRTVRRGLYGAGTGLSLPSGVTGRGALRVLHGSGGITISFR